MAIKLSMDPNLDDAKAQIVTGFDKAEIGNIGAALMQRSSIINYGRLFDSSPNF
jgi:hypothetical protein